MVVNDDLFGGQLPSAEPPPPVIPHPEIIWTRLHRAGNPPNCGHCMMLRHRGARFDSMPARWTRTGKDGSTMELCERHRQLQEDDDRTEAECERWASHYLKLARGVIDTMGNPDDWDDGQTDQTELLIAYVQFLAHKIQDIEAVLDRDMKT